VVDELPDAGGGATSCPDVGFIQENRGSAPTLVIEKMATTHFQEGDNLTLTASDATSKRVVDWSGTVRYQPHEVDEGPGCKPARCSVFSVEIPSM
jgi:hypothetical protein